MRSSQKGYQRNGYILIEVFAFENGYINKKKDSYYQVQDVLLITSVCFSMFEVPDGFVIFTFSNMIHIWTQINFLKLKLILKNKKNKNLVARWLRV